MLGIFSFASTRCLLRTATLKFPSTPVTGRGFCLVRVGGAEAIVGRSIFMLCGLRRSLVDPMRPFVIAMSCRYCFSFSFNWWFSFCSPRRSSSKHEQSISTFLYRVQKCSIFEMTCKFNCKNLESDIIIIFTCDLGK